MFLFKTLRGLLLKRLRGQFTCEIEYQRRVDVMQSYSCRKLSAPRGSVKEAVK